MTRVLVLSWEYPPIVEGGLARHVAKLSEQLSEQGTEVHVLTRGAPGDPELEVRAGVHVHRMLEAAKPRDLDEFLAWIDRMNGDMVVAGVALGGRLSFDVVHGHDWLVAMAGDRLARDLGCPLVMTMHATEHGRHQGWVDKHPQSYIHAAERWIARRADRVITCSYYMRGHVADVYGLPEEAVAVIPNGIDPEDLVPVEDLTTLRAKFAAPDEQRRLQRAPRVGAHVERPRRVLQHDLAGAHTTTASSADSRRNSARPAPRASTAAASTSSLPRVIEMM